MDPTTYGVKNIVGRSTNTLDGATPAELTASGNRRSSVLVHNASASLKLYVRLTKAGASAPTISATDRDFVVAAEDTQSIDVGESIAVWAINSSGDTTSSTATLVEVAY